jgi:hypothetical protein
MIVEIETEVRKFIAEMLAKIDSLNSKYKAAA